MSGSESVWEEIDRNLAYWNAPGEGDVALEVWSRFNGTVERLGYAIIPLVGSWAEVRAAIESGELLRRFTAHAGVRAESMAVNVYESGQWNRRAIWSKKEGTWN